MAIKPTGCRVLLAQSQHACCHIEVKDALRLKWTAKMEAQRLCRRIEIDFVLIHEGARGNADCGWTRHRNFAEFREIEYADHRPTFVFDVHDHECLEHFEMAEMMTYLLWNDFPPMRRRGRRLGCAH